MHSTTVSLQPLNERGPVFMSQGCISLQTVFDVALQEDVTPIVPQVEAIVHFLQGALPEALQVEPAAQGTWHTVFDVAVQVSLTPARSHLESTAHFSHGSLPDFEKDLLPMQGAASPLHTISEPGVQGALMPFAPQVEAAAHFVHGALPEELHVVRAAHATWQTVSVLVVHALRTPDLHIVAGLHLVQEGPLPNLDQEIPTMQEISSFSCGGLHGIAPHIFCLCSSVVDGKLHTRFAFARQ